MEIATRCVIAATGVRVRRLQVPRLEEFEALLEADLRAGESDEPAAGANQAPVAAAETGEPGSVAGEE